MNSLFNKMSKELLSEDKNSKILIEGNIALNEGLKDSLRKIKVWATKKLGQIKIWVKKIGNKIFPFYQKGKEKGVLDPNGQSMAKWVGNNSKMTFIINPAIRKNTTYVPIPESVKYSFEALFEVRTKAEIEHELAKSSDEIYKGIEDIEDPDEDTLVGSSTAKVNYEDISKILSQMAFSLKFRTSEKQDVPSMLMMGPPGAGKTTVVKQFAEQNGFNLKIMEIASIYKEMLGGFPVIEQVLTGKKTANGLSETEKKQLAEFQSQIKMKASDILPPSGDNGKWILFLDEFNRDSEKMGAAMNLALTGNIGTAYSLPLKTIVIAAGNVGEDYDGVPVADIDAATWDRFNRKVELQYDWISWLKYQKEEDVDISMGEAPVIIKGFVDRETKRQGTDSWTIDLKQFNPDVTGKARITPRTMSKFARQMKEAAKLDYDNNDLVGKNDKKFYEEGYKKAGFDSAAAYYLHKNQLNKRYFTDIARTIFGPEAGDLITNMMTDTMKAKEEMAAGFKPEDILIKWTQVRDNGKKKVKAKTGNEFAHKLPLLLKKIKTESEFKKLVDASGVDKDLLVKVDNDYSMWAAVNIHNFLKDSNLGMDVVTGICKSLSELREPTQVEENEKKGKSVKYELLDKILANLLEASDTFSEAWHTVADAASEELGDTSEFATAYKAAQKGLLLTGQPPKYVTDAIADQELRDYLLITNLQMQNNKILKKIKTEAEKEAKKKMDDTNIEEGIKNLFNKMLLG